jgi:N-acetylglucosaminyldiphosphoundecaprenol N-acetyl-beta-D-mannosaminyltransferase
MRIDFLGVPVDSLDMPDALQRVDEFIAAAKPHQIVVANVNKLWQIHRDPRLATIAKQADLVVPERVLVAFAGLLGTPLKSDVAGVALAKELLPHCEKRGHSIFFLGSRPAVMDLLIKKVILDHPALRIAGYHHGYFTPDNQEDLLVSIRKAKPDVLLVAMGSPRQEYWIHDHIAEIGVPVSVGVGGTFDVIAGIKKDAPQWVRRSGMEWLYRLSQDPKNLWKRYSITIPWFLTTILAESIRRRKPRPL